MRKISLLFIAMIFCGCQSENKFDNPVFGHILQLSFQDNSGNDLVKGIGYDSTRYGSQVQGAYGSVLPELYTLDVVYGQPCEYQLVPTPGIIYDLAFPKMVMREVDGKYYLYFSESSIKVESCSALERTMTLKLTCPYVFGDDKEREIVTFWEADDLERPDMVCYRIEFDGEEITGITHIFNYLYEATIILDR